MLDRMSSTQKLGVIGFVLGVLTVIIVLFALR
jgi:hypothetical protein